MAITVQQALDRAVQRSALNNPDLVPTAQAIAYISNFERKLFIQGAELNPEYFGKSADTAARADDTAAWDLDTTPGDVAAVTMAEVKAITGTVTGVSIGDEVNLISKRWPTMDVSPRAYIRGRSIYQYQSELGTNASNFVTTLTVYYSELPPVVSALATTLRVPDQWQDLVILPLARLLAIRDKREEEAQVIDAEYNALLTDFQKAVVVFDHGVLRPLDAVPAALPRRPGA